MAKWGNCDYKQLQQLRENIAHLQGIDMDKFCKDMSKELARKLLQLVIRRTPVGRYDGETYTCAMGKTHQAHTVKGKGVSFMENECDWHGSAPKLEQYNQAMDELNKALAELEA